MDYKFIKVDYHSRITTITLDRPQVRNAINPSMHHELQAAFDAFAADPEQFICVLTGTGEHAFCAGSDLKAAAAGERQPFPINGYGGIAQRFDLFKPVIAAVNGDCLGGGFEIALACDLIIAVDDACFALTEPRVGAIALAGGIHRLVRQIGIKRALGHLVTCTPISAQQGLELGFVNEVVPRDQLQATVDRWCEQILANAPIAVRATKEVAMRGLAEPSLAAAIQNQIEYPGFKDWMSAADTVEGYTAFAQKRPPAWRGR